MRIPDEVKDHIRLLNIICDERHARCCAYMSEIERLKEENEILRMQILNQMYNKNVKENEDGKDTSV